MLCSAQMPGPECAGLLLNPIALVRLVACMLLALAASGPARASSPPAFGAVLRACRRARGWSRAYLAQRLGRSVGCLARLEAGSRQAARRTLARLVPALDPSPAERIWLYATAGYWPPAADAPALPAWPWPAVGPAPEAPPGPLARVLAALSATYPAVAAGLGTVMSAGMHYAIATGRRRLSRARVAALAALAPLTPAERVWLHAAAGYWPPPDPAWQPALPPAPWPLALDGSQPEPAPEFERRDRVWRPLAPALALERGCPRCQSRLVHGAYSVDVHAYEGTCLMCGETWWALAPRARPAAALAPG